MDAKDLKEVKDTLLRVANKLSGNPCKYKTLCELLLMYCKIIV